MLAIHHVHHDIATAAIKRPCPTCGAHRRHIFVGKSALHAHARAVRLTLASWADHRALRDAARRWAW